MLEGTALLRYGFNVDFLNFTSNYEMRRQKQDGMAGVKGYVCATKQEEDSLESFYLTSY